MVDLSPDLNFNWYSFLLVTFFTILPFKWVFKRSQKEKLYYLSYILFLWIYSGVGYGWATCPSGYIWPFLIYMMSFGLSCLLANPSHRKIRVLESNETALKSIINQYGKVIVLMYIFLCFMGLVIAGKLSNLINPPSADLKSLMTDIAGEETSKSGSEMILYYIQNIVYVFYLVSLYVYKEKIIKLSFFLIFPSYITYVSSGYIGRGEVMMLAITIFIAIYLKYPQYRKKFIIGVLTVIPFIVIVLFWYSLFRLGREVNLADIDISDAVATLSYQETNFPIQYADVSKWNYDPNMTSSYFTWLINLPLPGFMKIGSGDFAFNVIFSEKILGGVRGLDGFFVSLPGIVNESIFIFGPVFFFIHAFILGLIVSKALRFVKYDCELFLLIHLGFSVAFQVGRAGTSASGVYPFFFKHFLIYLIVRYLLIHFYLKKHKQINYNYNNEKNSVSSV